MSVVSFLLIISSIKKSRILDKYRQNEALNARMPNYSVKIGFGLHFGWAIEGAIGSDFKIDASYLSPNVNMASTLEAATKQYGVPLLLTGDLYNIFNDKLKAQCRMIDWVTFKGNPKKYDLYTVDVCTDNIELEEENKREMKLQELKSLRVRKRARRNVFKN